MSKEKEMEVTTNELTEINELINQANKKRDESDKKVLMEVLKDLPLQMILDIGYMLQKCEGHYNYEIVTEPKGNLQKKGNTPIYVYVDQHTDMMEDDFYGHIYITIDDKKYLKATFDC